MKKQIFISYRRDGGEFFGKILHDELTHRGYSVFFDVESLESGAFNAQIYRIIDECTDFLLILPPNALDRCYEEGDWVAAEIRYAIKMKKNIIPIMMKHFEWPEVMPEGMEQLPYYEGEQFSSNVNQEHIHATINVLCNKLLKARPHRFRRYLLPVTIGALILAVVLFAVFWFLKHKKDPTPPVIETETSVQKDIPATSDSEEVTEPTSTYNSESYLHSLFTNNVCHRNFENEICFLYADYDRDGSFEAFAATGNKADYTYKNASCYEDVVLYYIDSNGTITQAAEPGSGYNGCDAYSQSTNNLLDTGTDQYFVWENYSGGVYSKTFLYGVRDGKQYSPKCSGEYFDFHFDTDHFDAWLDYPDYAHDKDEFWLMYDNNKREFVTIARTFREDEPRIIKSLNTASGLLVQDGSTVNIDYIELLDGNEIKLLGTAGSGVDVTIGSGNSIGDFEEQLIGHKVGETFTIFVDVPEEYYISDIAGKTVQFQITINGIYK